MKIFNCFALLFIILFFTACKNNVSNVPIQQPPEKSKIVTIHLADSLGNITLSLPERYDTNFTWTDQSDCGKPCVNIKYRFQPKGLRITKETGWIWLSEPEDSVERFTVSHSAYFPFYENYDSSFIFRYHQHQKGNIVQNPFTYKIESDTLENINGSYFSIFTINLYDSVKALYSKKLLTATAVHKNIIEISFELLTKEKDSLPENFLANALFYLRTVNLQKTK